MPNEIDYRQALLHMILDTGALRFGKFRMKLHDSDPDAPLSPVYLNLRTDRHPDPRKRGPLKERHCRTIAQALAQATASLPGFDGYVAGLPFAADPFVDAAAHFVEYHGRINFLHLGKLVDEASGSRQIVLRDDCRYPEGKRVVLWDDLITGADSKIEAIEGLRSAGCLVEDAVVLVDRQQGGANELAEVGVRLHAILPFLDYVLPHARFFSLVNDEDWRRCQEYFTAQGHPLPEEPEIL